MRKTVCVIVMLAVGLLLALPAGVLVEHLDKRKAVIFFQSVMAVLAFLLHDP